MNQHEKELHDLRYPIGEYSRPASSMAGIRAAQIDTLQRLPERLTKSIAGLDDIQLNTPYRDGGWTVRQVIHHVADSHANAYIRTRLALTEDWPTIKPYEEGAWAELLDARTLPPSYSLDLLTSLHARWIVLLESMSETDFDRGYIHPAHGRQNLSHVLSNYDWHSRHHTAHVVNLRKRMGW